MISVTRFGEMLPFVRGVILHWAKFATTLAIFMLYGNYHCCKCPKIEQIIQPSGHTDYDTHVLLRSLVGFVELSNDNVPHKSKYKPNSPGTKHRIFSPKFHSRDCWEYLAYLLQAIFHTQACLIAGSTRLVTKHPVLIRY